MQKLSVNLSTALSMKEQKLSTKKNSYKLDNENSYLKSTSTSTALTLITVKIITLKVNDSNRSREKQTFYRDSHFEIFAEWRNKKQFPSYQRVDHGPHLLESYFLLSCEEEKEENSHDNIFLINLGIKSSKNAVAESSLKIPVFLNSFYLSRGYNSSHCEWYPLKKQKARALIEISHIPSLSFIAQEEMPVEKADSSPGFLLTRLQRIRKILFLILILVFLSESPLFISSNKNTQNFHHKNQTNSLQMSNTTQATDERNFLSVNECTVEYEDILKQLNALQKSQVMMLNKKNNIQDTIPKSSHLMSMTLTRPKIFETRQSVPIMQHVFTNFISPMKKLITMVIVPQKSLMHVMLYACVLFLL